MAAFKYSTVQVEKYSNFATEIELSVLGLSPFGLANVPASSSIFLNLMVWIFPSHLTAISFVFLVNEFIPFVMITAVCYIRFIPRRTMPLQDSLEVIFTTSFSLLHGTSSSELLGKEMVVGESSKYKLIVLPISRSLRSCVK